MTFIASAGDRGSQVNWPVVSPNVLSVGGTTFKLDINGKVVKNEIAWQNSGGRTSMYIKQPSYQKEYGIKHNTKAVSDVSFFADSSIGVAVYCSTKYNPSTLGWIKMSGTSLGSPACSALIALANEKNKKSIFYLLDFYTLF
ncbi:hypothetical protein FDG09_11215 [Clostridium sporogenes]|uniref:S8 family serine peptidase n=1 Tax=Clostridium sporogenes TaxID=1509 RepID=UPI0013D05AB5|nr:hypothetical protein [Clostridium sporogenes]